MQSMCKDLPRRYLAEVQKERNREWVRMVVEILKKELEEKG